MIENVFALDYDEKPNYEEIKKILKLYLLKTCRTLSKKVKFEWIVICKTVNYIELKL